jgi:hypothetical protein
LGTTGGAVQLPFGKNGIVLGAWAASLLKGKSLRAEIRWKALGSIPDQEIFQPDRFKKLASPDPSSQ